MTCVMREKPWISYFLPMIPTYFFSHNGSNQLMEIVNNELKKLSSWFQANKLSINLKNLIFFYLKQNKTGKNLSYSFQLMVLKLIV